MAFSEPDNGTESATKVDKIAGVFGRIANFPPDRGDGQERLTKNGPGNPKKRQSISSRVVSAPFGGTHKRRQHEWQDGIWDELVSILALRLGTTGLREVRSRMQAWQAEMVVLPPARERRVIGWSSSGPIHADEVQVHHRRHASTLVLKQVADALGDVDGFIDQFDERARRMPVVAATIARRLLDAGRLQDAWAALEVVEAGQRDGAPAEWEEVRIEVLDALGRSDQGQAFRWARFLAKLDATHLRAFSRSCPISTTWRPSSGPWITRSPSKTCIRRWCSSPRGPICSGPIASCWTGIVAGW